MLACRLGKSTSHFSRINRWSTVGLFQSNRKASTIKDESDRPIAFSQTEAAKWKAEYARVPPDERVWWTPYSVAVSMLSFMAYFFILREENDIDEMIYRPLPETLEGIDKAFPNMDFYTKPDYVKYHEDKKKKTENK
ncbi:hypothetical protein QAD02_006946 [Eretmocerus hayati]|uniref:Uncharacterized protein n=1 Tax=Eretmocerus hayati TaxID=131215 RepID=A0ACC2N4P1_9HYME|nr:hypothetical protein QAD02_006946 [Eretmocerus hayati]